MRKFCNYTAMIVAVLSMSVAQVHGQSASTTESILDFGNVELGMQGAEIVTVTNSSTNTIGVMATVQGGANGFSTDLAPLFFTLPPNGSVDNNGDPSDILDINVYFDPIANGDATDVLVCDVVVFDTHGSLIGTEQETVDLIGTGGPDEDDLGDLINEILAFYDQSIADGTLVSTGNHPNRRHRALRNRLRAIGWLIEHGYFCHASYITHTAIMRTDGAPHPKDFVEGSSLQELNDMLVLLQVLLDA